MIMTQQIASWDSFKQTIEESLNLPQGTLIADFDGLPIEQDCESEWTMRAAKAIKSLIVSYLAKPENQEIAANAQDLEEIEGVPRFYQSQADLITTAQKKGLEFGDFFGRFVRL